MPLTKATYSMIKGSPANVFDFMTAVQIASVQAADMVEDVTEAIQAAIDSLGGTYDITSAYEFVPAQVLEFPPGTYKVSDTILIGVNNIVIQGSGWYNTIIKCADDVQITEVLRIQGAYCGELNDINIDGGLPFTPTGSETYGADIGVTFDQVALFSSRNLNITNTRYEGKRCIHLWECYFENLRIFNIGFFGDGSNRSAGIRYTLVGKQNNVFPGGESNNVTYNKIAFGTTGSYVSMDEVPCYNMYFNDIIAEGRTWATAWPSTSEAKWRLGATSSNIAIDNGYTFAHSQTFESNATLFDVGTIDVTIKNYRVYSYKDSTYLEVTNIINAAESTEIDLYLEEQNSSEITLIGAIDNNVTINGTIYYTCTDARTRASLFGTNCERSYIGTLNTLIDGVQQDTTYTGPSVNTQVAGVSDGDPATGETFVRTVYPCYFWASYDGVNNALRGSGGLTVTKNSAGNYTFNFDTAMFDNGYAVVATSTALAAVASPTTSGFTIIVSGGDSSYVNVVVYR